MEGYTPIDVVNDELITVRDAMRTLNRLVEDLQGDDEKKYVLTRHGKMVGVLLSVEDYADLLALIRRYVASP